ncbi:hypothetical protein HPB50_025744 [Hyalomma asiaticum]|uniref:Uncharacterized protein n=1 Tax=Hyalomma asiaticum TaxID=266040 RepID=A0ACB7TNT6_HYAAI|nr:hypothetical protein HPB50_025744 [Hyalomma asiaticum]
MEYQVSGVDLPAAEFNPEEWSEIPNARKTSQESEGTQSSNAVSADETQVRKPVTAPGVPSQLDDTTAALLRMRTVPRLPLDDFKIVFRPTAGVNLAKFNDGEPAGGRCRQQRAAAFGCRGGHHVHEPTQEYLHDVYFMR